MRTLLQSFRALLITLAVGTAIGCASEGAEETDPVPAMMEQGLQMLYGAADPEAAERVFREVLQRNPTHYGATYQLAVALDSAGRPSEARTHWQAVQRLAGESGDTATARIAQTRLAAPDTATESAMMRRGLRLLYADADAAGATEQFRAMLAKNPTHYGATYQLATALDRLERRDEARPLWVKMLGMATAVKDSTTAATARARLR